VTKIATIKMLVALVAIHGLLVHQMDVKTTFLNGDLEEEIYISQLETVQILDRRTKYVSLKNPFTVLHKLLNNGMKIMIAQYHKMALL